MEGSKLFTCHLEAEPDQYPEYCVQNVCCGIYRQRSWLASFVYLTLTSLLIVSLTCCVIYLWVTLVEEDEYGSNIRSNSQTSVRRNKEMEKDRKGLLKTEKVTTVPNLQPTIHKETNISKKEVEVEEDNESEEDEDETTPQDSSKTNAVKEPSESTNRNKILAKNSPNHNQNVKTDSNSQRNDQIDENSHNLNKHNDLNQPSTSLRKNNNENITIRYMKEEYFIPEENNKTEDVDEKGDDSKSSEYLNISYKELEIKTNK